MKRLTKLSWLAATLVVSLLSVPGMTNADPPSAPDALRGEKTFTAVCSLCHNEDASGREELGLNLRTSKFVRFSTDDQLVNFIKKGREGRPRWARRQDGVLVEETCGFNMPPKGGANYLTNAELADVVHYLRTINK